MGHPIIENETPFVSGHLFVPDESGTQLLVPLLKQTFSIDPDGGLQLCPQQEGVCFAGEFNGEPGRSSYRIEPEVAFFKPGTDVVLLGHADAGEREALELTVGLRIGPIRKLVRVVGDRWWTTGFTGRAKLSPPQAFRRIALTFENAYGGHDAARPKAEDGAYYLRNPVGTGYCTAWPGGEARLRAPNLEDPNRAIQRIDDRPAPLGFGFVSPHWQPRNLRGGTYDSAWERDRKPLLPADFDRRYFNAAPDDQVAPGWLRGDELVTLLNVTPAGRLEFRLPALPPPAFHVEWRRGQPATAQGVLDSVVIDPDHLRLNLTWRAHTPCPGQLQDLRVLRTSVAGLSGKPRPEPRAPTS